MNLNLREGLPSLVSRRFAAAKESGSLIFSATQLAILSSKRGINYQLRYCPALARKPGADKQSSNKSASDPKPDPFENPSKDLLIAEVALSAPSSSGALSEATENSHNLVLNKYPVIPNHFILATKRFENQTDLLEKDDLGLAYACIETWRDNKPERRQQHQQQQQEESRRLFAFFNSGPDSGASQPHRHLQFLPIDDMRAQEEDFKGKQSSVTWKPLIDLFSTSSNIVQTSSSGTISLPNLPFRHFTVRIPRSSSLSAEALHEMYLTLYREALQALKITSTEEVRRTSGPAAISYNLAMTEDIMMITPRRKESAFLPGFADMDSAEVSLNGTILAGTLMVKSEKQWKFLIENVEVISDMLRDVGIAKSLESTVHI